MAEVILKPVCEGDPEEVNFRKRRQMLHLVLGFANLCAKENIRGETDVMVF